MGCNAGMPTWALCAALCLAPCVFNARCLIPCVWCSWQGVEASDNGVLCGYANLSPIDLRDSRQFLAEVYSRQLAAAKASNRPLVALGEPSDRECSFLFRSARTSLL